MIRAIWKRLLKVFLLGAALGAVAGMLNPPKPRPDDAEGSGPPSVPPLEDQASEEK